MTNPTNPGNTLRHGPITFNRRKKKLLRFLYLFLTGMALVTLLSPKEYRSQAKLFVRLGRDSAPTATSGQKTIVVMPQSRESEINLLGAVLNKWQQHVPTWLF